MVNLFLKTKPDTSKAFERIKAWLAHDIIDRVPVQFHRQDMTKKIDKAISGWDSMKARWFDSEYQINRFIKSLETREFLAESFPYSGQIWDLMFLQLYTVLNWNMPRKLPMPSIATTQYLNWEISLSYPQRIPILKSWKR